MRINDRFRFRVYKKVFEQYLYDAQDGEWPDWPLKEYLYNDKFIVEQCTGLKDKNGRLIYEGDIICDADLADIYEQRTGIGEIRWNGDNAEFALYMTDGDYISLDNMSSSAEIIGNIHKNAELLEENK